MDVVDELLERRLPEYLLEGDLRLAERLVAALLVIRVLLVVRRVAFRFFFSLPSECKIADLFPHTFQGTCRVVVVELNILRFLHNHFALFHFHIRVLRRLQALNETIAN